MQDDLAAMSSNSPRRRARVIVTCSLFAFVAIGLGGWHFWRASLPSRLREQSKHAAQRGRWPEVDRLTARRIELDPRDGEAWLLRARSLHEQHNLDASAKVLSAVPDDCPEKLTAWRALAELQMGPLNDPLAAAQTLCRILERDPLSEFGNQRLIFFYAMTRQRQEMVREVRRAMQMHCEPIEAYIYLFFADELDFTNGAQLNGHWLSGDPQSELFRVAEALNIAHALAGGVARDDLESVRRVRRMADDKDRVLAELLQKYPDNLELLAWHIEQAMEHGNLERTVELLARLPASADGDNRFWRYAGWAQAQDHDFDKALANYNKALELHPLDWSTRHLLAGLRREQQDFEEVDRLQRLVRTARELEHALKVLPDARSATTELLSQLADYAVRCGDEMYASALRQRLSLASAATGMKNHAE